MVTIPNMCNVKIKSAVKYDPKFKVFPEESYVWAVQNKVIK